MADYTGTASATTSTYQAPKTSFTAQTYTTGTETAGDRYGSYLAKMYDTGTSIPTNERGENIYDIQRTETQRDLGGQEQSYRDALMRRMSQAGVDDSGIALKQQRMLTESLASEGGKRLSAIDQAELADQSQREREMAQMAFQGEQGALGRGLQERLTMADLSFRERQFAEQARQFDTQVEFDAWATQQGLNEKEKDRVWQALQNEQERGLQRELTYASLSLDEKKLYENARQFDNKLDFDKWAVQQGLNENEKQRVWEAIENDKNRKVEYAGLSIQEKTLAQRAYEFNTRTEFDRWAKLMDLDEATAERVWQANENQKTRDQETDMARLTSDLMSNRMTLADYLEEQKGIRATTTQLYHDKGALVASGQQEPISESDLEVLRTTNPTAYWAYQGGMAGKSLADTQNNVELRNDIIHAIIAAVDPNDNNFQNQMTTIANSLGFGLETLSNISTIQGLSDTRTQIEKDSEDYQTLVDNSPELTQESAQGIATNRLTIQGYTGPNGVKNLIAFPESYQYPGVNNYFTLRAAENSKPVLFKQISEPTIVEDYAGNNYVMAYKAIDMATGDIKWISAETGLPRQITEI